MMVTGLKKSGSLGTQFSDMRFVQNFTLSISPNFKSDKTHKKMSENGEIYTAGKKIYTAAGTDGMDKFHLWSK